MTEEKETSDPTDNSNQNNHPLDPGEFGILVREWFKHYWDTPRKKSAWTDIFMVVLTVLIAGAALYSAWSFSEQLTEVHLQTQLGERPWMGLIGSVTIDSLNMTQPRYRLTAHYQLKNFGHGPAYKIIASGWFSTTYEDYRMMGEHACDNSMPFTEGTVSVGPGVNQPPRSETCDSLTKLWMKQLASRTTRSLAPTHQTSEKFGLLAV